MPAMRSSARDSAPATLEEMRFAHGRRVLVVDDDPLVATLLDRILRKHFEVAVFTDARADGVLPFALAMEMMRLTRETLRPGCRAIAVSGISVPEIPRWRATPMRLICGTGHWRNGCFNVEDTSEQASGCLT